MEIYFKLLGGRKWFIMDFVLIIALFCCVVKQQNNVVRNLKLVDLSKLKSKMVTMNMTTEKTF